MRDEAPAATTGGVNELSLTAWSLARPCAGLWFLFGPTSFVAAEIHHGRRPAGICDGWLHCNIQVACQIDSLGILFYFNLL
jgi:hypothetical protein